MEEKYIVYVRVDEASRVTEINSSEFISDTTGWVQIDEGTGDRFHHAQNNYLLKSLMDERSIYRYKYDGSSVIERSQEEMAADYVPPALSPVEQHDEMLAQLTYELALLQMGV